ncbi:MAG: hemolysin family protein [Clostridiales bacterium]|nr:hemolysin family protein [Clostridiales bacterium]
MGSQIVWQLLFQLVLILINAFFACAEIAVISINDAKLARMAAVGDRKAARLYALTKQPAKFLATIQVGITLAGYLGSAFAANNFSDGLTDWLVSLGLNVSRATLSAISVTGITLVLSYVTLVLGELVPKRLAMQRSEKLGLAMSGVVYFVSKISAPVVWFLTKSANALLRALGVDPEANGEIVTEEEIRMMVDVGTEKGTIDAGEKEIIHNVFEFNNKTADEVMTHRTAVTLLWQADDDAEWESVIVGSKYSYFPVCGETVDDVVGILSAKDYLRARIRSHSNGELSVGEVSVGELSVGEVSDKARSQRPALNREELLRQVVRPPQFVPESVRTDVLFRNMKKSRCHFAVVLDEYGGMSGIVTMNDLLEELVGDLDDDSDAEPEEPDIEKLDDKVWRISGSALLERVSETLGVPLPDEEYATFAGMVLGLLGTVPKDGDTPELTGYGLTIKITEVKEHRLESAAVYITEDQA